MEEHEIADHWKAYLLGRLFEVRPRALDVSTEMLSDGTGLCPEVEPDDFFDDVIEWLTEAGLIRLRANQSCAGNAFDVLLTARARSALEAGDPTLTGQIGTTLVQAIKTAPGEIMKLSLGVMWKLIEAKAGLPASDS